MISFGVNFFPLNNSEALYSLPAKITQIAADAYSINREIMVCQIGETPDTALIVPTVGDVKGI